MTGPVWPDLAGVRADVAAALRDGGVADGGDLPLAVSEVVANAHEHGRPPVEVDVRIEAGDVTVVVRDRGAGPAHLGAPTPPGADAERGRGRSLAHQLAIVWEARTATGCEVRLRPRRRGGAGVGTGPG